MGKLQVTRREFIHTVSKGAVAIGVAPYVRPLYAATPTGTGYIYDDRYLDHEISSGHVESPERLVKIQERMAATGLDKEVVNLPLFNDPLTYIRMTHTSSHISSIQNIPTTGEVAELASGGVLGGAKAVCEGTVRNAFCAVRPPGHHAHDTGREEGFCYYNNVAVATKYIQDVYNIEKVLIIDWDFHHGNGTQDEFYRDGSVLFFSTHNWRAYPNSGDPSLTGAGDGAGLNINVHLPEGSGDDEMKAAWNDKLLPKVEEFKPDFVFISAGFDSRENDRLGNLEVTDDCFAHITQLALEIAKTHCDNKLVSLLEGGYNVDGTASATVVHVAELLAGSTGVYSKAKHKEKSKAFVSNSILYVPINKNRITGITIHSAAGEVVKNLSSSSIDNGKILLNRMGLAAGNYFAVIKIQGQKEQAVKFILSK
jgi:acetoin utilization deacetylase AcuC-like enzyme